MQLKCYGKAHSMPGRFSQKLALIMRLTLFLIIVACLKVTAGTYAQSVSVSLKNASLEEVFDAVKKQTGYVFFYERGVLRATKRVSMDASNLSLNDFLTQVFAAQPLDYSIKDKTIFIKRKTIVAEILQAAEPIYGTVRGADGGGLPGVSVKIKGTSKGTVSDVNGRFYIDAKEGQVLVISYVGHETQEVTVKGNNYNIMLKEAVSALDEMVVIGYGSAVRRTSTGSISSIKAKDIGSQAVGDPLAALQGRVPGLMITSSSGLSGSNFQVRLRGQNSLREYANDPLYVIDGVPYFSEPLNQFTSSNGTQSPLASINPADIERIDVLKDADATAIYGSRAANGVILITTKKGAVGKTTVDIRAYTGASKVVNMVPMLGTQEYLKMRQEAFAYDNTTPTVDNAPELLVWDQNKYTDWQKYMMGNTGHMSDVQGSVSGGNAQTRFMLSGNYHRETSVMPNNLPFSRGSARLSMDHTSLDSKFNASATVNYAGINDRSIATDLTSFYNIAPNYPMYTATGDYYWFKNEQNMDAYMLRRSKVTTGNLVANSTLRYTILPGLNLKANLGYTNSNMDQMQIYPFKSLNPVNATGSFSYFGNTNVQNYIIEPQADYNLSIGKGELQLLAGATWQENIRQGSGFTAEDFSSDALLEDIRSAGTLTARPTQYVFYRYTSVFGRATYNWDDKYIANVNFRRDGSTRFGPGMRFGNFASIGAAWVFSSEPFMQALPFMSFGKLRASYGLTGNDQIGDYAYLDSWATTSYAYDAVAGLSPSRIPNPYFRWEENRKMEFALETGFLKDRILFNTNFYRNLSGNQLVELALSPQTGFTSITANFPAVVLNTGWEFELNTKNIQKMDFTWSTNFNISFNKNELKEYPDFENSSYKDVYQVGQSLSIVRGYQFTGIDPETGKATFLDIDNSGTYDEFVDYVTLGKTMPEFFGGFQNSLTYKGFSLDVMLQFVKQEGPLLNYGYLSEPYGAMDVNKDLSALDRWQTKGQVTSIPAATTTPANVLYDLYRLSSGVWGDASYIRLKTLTLGYDLSRFTKGWKMSTTRVFASAQNLFTITNYDGFDPETKGLLMPPMKTITAGLQVSF